MAVSLDQKEPTLAQLAVPRNADLIADPVCRLALGTVIELTAPGREAMAEYENRLTGMGRVRRFFTWPPAPQLLSPDTVVGHFPLDQRGAAVLALRQLDEAGYVKLDTHEPTEWECYHVVDPTKKGLEAYHRELTHTSDNNLANHTLPNVRGGCD